MRRLCVLLIVVALAPAFAQEYNVPFRPRTAAAPPSADILDESFNNVTNYDDADWVATTASGGVLDPNEAAAGLCDNLTGFGTGFTSECLESTAAAANRKAWTVNSLAALHDDAQYTVIYFAITAMTAWADGSTQVIVEGRSKFCGPTTTTQACRVDGDCTTGGDTCQPEVTPSVASAAFGAQLVYDADGFTATRDTCGGGTPRACWRLDMRIGGVGSTASDGLPEVLADQAYQMKFLVDKGSSTGEAIFKAVGGSPVTIVTAQDSAFTLGYVRLGQAEFSLAAETILYDGVRISSTAYVETP